MKLKKFISHSERKRIEEAVQRAEALTSGEIVPVFVESSSRYDWIGYRGALVGWLAASVVALWLHFYRPFVLEFWETQAVQILGLLLGWGFSQFSFGVRFLVSERVMAEEVHQAAQAAFLTHGLVNTRDRTGVLLFVSLRERRVQIIADKGIHEKVGNDFWKLEVEKVVGAIRQGRPAEGMIGAIRDIGEKLQTYFPKQQDDSNELPDHLRS